MSGRFAAPLATIAALGLASSPPAQAKPLSSSDRQFVDATVAGAMAQGRLPGVTIRISGPKGSYAKAYGVSNIATRKPLAASDHVRIASITKSFTATAILQQVGRHRLKLTDKLDRWVKHIPNGRRITVRELLAMRSGIYDYTSDPRFTRAFSANPLLRFRPVDIIPIIKRHRPLFRPNVRTQYADSNYVLLGIILEKVTGRSVEAVIGQDIVKPLGLSKTSFPTTSRIAGPFSHGYYAGDKGDGPLRDYTAVNPAVAWTAGGMVSTIDDLYRWGRALATGSLLSRSVQAQRLKFGTIPNGAGPAVGYGLGILRFGDWLGHDGAIFGFSTETFYERSTGAQIVAAANLSSNSSTPTLEIFGQIAQHLYPASLRPR